MRSFLLRLVPGLAAGVLLIGVSGCFNPFRPLVSDEPAIAVPAPVPTTPLKLMELFRWCWENRDDVKYREVFTADYVFEFSTTDSSGVPYHDSPWRREDELIFAHNLFVAGSASEAPASSITLTFSGTIVDRDLRDGKTYPVHQSVITRTNLTIQKTDGTGLQVTGDAKFYVVRGDSADIPTDLGFAPDARRWYIERQIDLTAAGEPAAWLQPARPGSLTIRTWSAATRPADIPPPSGAAFAAAGTGAVLRAGVVPAALDTEDPLPSRRTVTWGGLKARYGPGR
jgi:hypothetical protein